MAEYGQNSLQQEAQNRIKQMYRYADIPPQETTVQAADEPVSVSFAANSEPPCESQKNTDIPFKNILKIFSDSGIENDNIVLLLLVFVLLKEGADFKLIAALAYIML